MDKIHKLCYHIEEKVIEVSPGHFITDKSLENYLNAKKKMPQMIYGTKGKRKKTIDLVIEAILVGFKGIDTSL